MDSWQLPERLSRIFRDLPGPFRFTCPTIRKYTRSVAAVVTLPLVGDPPSHITCPNGGVPWRSPSPQTFCPGESAGADVPVPVLAGVGVSRSGLKPNPDRKTPVWNFR